MRGVLRSWMPWFAQSAPTDRAVDAMGRAMDRVLQGSIDAVRARHPTVCPADALALIGADRRIPRAPSEPRESYERRLLLWLDLWALAGLPLGLLYAVQSYLYPTYPMVRLVTRSGYWWTLDAGASAALTPYEAMTVACTPEPGFVSNPLRYVPAVAASPRAAFWMHRAVPLNWNWDSNSNPDRVNNWWDFWLIIYPNYPLQTSWGDAGTVWGSTSSWGFNVPSGTVATLEYLVKSYSSAHSQCRSLIFPPSTSDFNPNTAPGDPSFPDGWWGQDQRVISGVSTPTRRTDCLFASIGY